MQTIGSFWYQPPQLTRGTFWDQTNKQQHQQHISTTTQLKIVSIELFGNIVLKNAKKIHRL